VLLFIANGSFTDPNLSYTKLFFDLAYPISDILIVTAAGFLGIPFKFFGGRYQTSIHAIFFSFFCMYVADFLFAYTTSANSYYNGNIADFAFTVAMCLLTFGILGFR